MPGAGVAPDTKILTRHSGPGSCRIQRTLLEGTSLVHAATAIPATNSRVK